MNKMLSDNIKRKFVESFDISDWEIETDTGWEEVTHIHKTVEYEVYHLELDNGQFLKCADDHIVFREDYSEVFVKDLIPGDLIIVAGGSAKVSSVKNLGYSENMYDVSVNHPNHRLYTNGILSHNTQTTASYLLHYGIFNKNKTIAILANKGSTAKEIISRIKTSYEELPLWLQPGVTEWNKQSIEFGNGTKIVAAATSSSAIRGLSISCVGANTNITLRNKRTNEIVNTTIGNFGDINQSIIPNDEFEILTPDGFKDFDGILKSKKQTLRIITSRSDLICTLDHRLLNSHHEWVEAKTLRPTDKVCTADGVQGVVSLELLGFEDVYDPINVDGNHSYISNSLVSHNCLYLDEFAFIHPNAANEFFESVYPTIASGERTKILISSTPKGLNHFYKMYTDAYEGRSEFKAYEVRWNDIPGRDEAFKQRTISTIGQLSWEQEFEGEFGSSGNTLISGDAIKNMVFGNPIVSTQDLKIYERPVSSDHHPSEDHVYVLSADCSEGVGGDYSVFHVIDITSYPFKQVATYRNNLISPLSLPDIIVTMAKNYNNAWILIEINSSGRQVADIIRWEHEYENILMTSVNEKRRQQLMFGSGQEMIPGVRTTKAVKKIGCSQLKHLIENNKLLITDKETISELSCFVRKGDSFEADSGHDDLVMGLVIFSWLVNQEFFKEISKSDIRKDLYDKIASRFDEELPIAIASTILGHSGEQRVIDKSGIIWTIG